MKRFLLAGGSECGTAIVVIRAIAALQFRGVWQRQSLTSLQQLAAVSCELSKNNDLSDPVRTTFHASHILLDLRAAAAQTWKSGLD